MRFNALVDVIENSLTEFLYYTYTHALHNNNNSSFTQRIHCFL